MNFWKKNYQVLIVPDYNAEPMNLRFSSGKIKLITIISFFLTVHILTGFIFYFKFIKTHRENTTLVATNTLLKEDNLRIYQLEDAFSKIEKSHLRFQNALGISQSDSNTMPDYLSNPIEQRENNINPVIDEPQVQPQFSSADFSSHLNFINSLSSPLHEFLPSLPTLLPVDGLLTSGFDDTSRKGIRHHGIDLAANRGTIIRAAGDGIIIFSNWTEDLGNLVIIYHGNDFFTIYGHNQVNLKQRLNTVRKGEPIALVGSTGESTNPHVHFEVWKNGIPMDPTLFILSLRDHTIS